MPDHGDQQQNLSQICAKFAETLTLNVIPEERPLLLIMPDLSETRFESLAAHFMLGAFERWILFLALVTELQPTRMLSLYAAELNLSQSEMLNAYLCPYVLQQWFKLFEHNALAQPGTLLSSGLIALTPSYQGRGSHRLDSVQITSGALALLQGATMPSPDTAKFLTPIEHGAFLGMSQWDALDELNWVFAQTEQSTTPGDVPDRQPVPIVNLYSATTDTALEVVRMYSSGLSQGQPIQSQASTRSDTRCWLLDFGQIERDVQQEGCSLEELLSGLSRDLSYLGGTLVVPIGEEPEEPPQAQATSRMGMLGWSKRSFTEALCHQLSSRQIFSSGHRGSRIILLSRDPITFDLKRDLYAIATLRATPEEQVGFWARALGFSELALRQPQVLAELQHLTTQFSLSSEKILQVARDAELHVTQRRSTCQPGTPQQAEQPTLKQKAGRISRAQSEVTQLQAAQPDANETEASWLAQLMEEVWESCKRQGRKAFQGIAERIEAAAAWDSLILPPEDLRTLHDIVTQVQHRHQVYRAWGYSAQERGLGITVLFTGTSGGGKTYAAEVLAGELGLDLYRIDLSSVTSKYIGETEKNLKRVFDAADEGGAILLFDEADSVFGKRGDAQSSNDRYANLTTNYLLQRMEAYRGLAILTSNYEGNIDTAFMRRIRFTLRFREPDQALREQLWQRAFPEGVETQRLDYQRLARPKLTGAHVKAVAMNASFLAAARKVPITTELIEEAMTRELRRQGRLILGPN